MKDKIQENYSLSDPMILNNQVYPYANISYGSTKSKGQPISKERREFDIKYHNINRNDLCPCNSGKKFKSCCLKNRPK